VPEPFAVVLRCVNDTRVDIVVADNEAAAIGEVIARAFRSAAPPALPLVATHAAQIPRSVLAELAGQVAPPPVLPPPRPRVHVVGLLQIARIYTSSLVADPEGAKNKLIEFFQHYDIDIDFTVARPLPAPRRGNGQHVGERDGAG
jgi:hypothetical protein